MGKQFMPHRARMKTLPKPHKHSTLPAGEALASPVQPFPNLLWLGGVRVMVAKPSPVHRCRLHVAGYTDACPFVRNCLRVGCGSPQHGLPPPNLEGNRSFWAVGFDGTADPTGLFGDFPIPGSMTLHGCR
jgi:hypothetical protein